MQCSLAWRVLMPGHWHELGWAEPNVLALRTLSAAARSAQEYSACVERANVHVVQVIGAEIISASRCLVQVTNAAPRAIVDRRCGRHCAGLVIVARRSALGTIDNVRG